MIFPQGRKPAGKDTDGAAPVALDRERGLLADRGVVVADGGGPG